MTDFSSLPDEIFDQTQNCFWVDLMPDLTPEQQAACDDYWAAQNHEEQHLAYVRMLRAGLPPSFGESPERVEQIKNCPDCPPDTKIRKIAITKGAPPLFWPGPLASAIYDDIMRWQTDHYGVAPPSWAISHGDYAALLAESRDRANCEVRDITIAGVKILHGIIDDKYALKSEIPPLKPVDSATTLKLLQEVTRERFAGLSGKPASPPLPDREPDTLPNVIVNPGQGYTTRPLLPYEGPDHVQWNGSHDWRAPEPGEPQEEGAVCKRCGCFANSESGSPCVDDTPLSERGFGTDTGE